MADPKLTAAAITLLGEMNTMAIFHVMESIEKSNKDLEGTIRDVPPVAEHLMPTLTCNRATLDAIKRILSAKVTSDEAFESLKQRNQQELAALKGRGKRSRDK